jgi:hypothetical protein
MNSGPIGNTLNFWANIRVSTTGDLTPAQLTAIVNAIEAIAVPAGAKLEIVTKARISKDAQTQFTATYVE